MNSIRTWLLVSATIILFAFIALYEKRLPSAADGGHYDTHLFPHFDPATASSIEVVMRTNRILRAERIHSGWNLVLPFSCPAYSVRIENLLSVFGQLNRQAHISAQELITQKQSLAAFGLDPPQATMVVQQGANRLELKVGGRTPVGNQVYVQLVGADGIFFTDAAILERLPYTNDDWRDPTFLPLKGLSVNRLNVRCGSRSPLELVIDPSTQLWKFKQPIPEARADNFKITQLLSQFEAWQIRKFLSIASTQELDSLGLQTPETILTFSQGTNDLLVAQFGKSPTNDPTLVYARCLPQGAPVLVPRELLDKISAPFAEFRDPHLFPLPRANFDLIEVQAEESFVVQKQAPGTWWITKPQKHLADAELMQQFFGNLSGLEVVDFVKDVVTDFSSFGFDPQAPKRRYIFRQSLTNVVTGETNPIRAQLDFGAVQGQNDRILAAVGGETSVYATKLGACLRLPSQAYQLYDRQLWHFKTNDVNSIAITIKDLVWKLSRNPGRQWTLVPSPAPLGTPLTNILEEVIFRLGSLRAESWTARGEEQMARFGFPDENHHLTLEVMVAGKPQAFTLDFATYPRAQKVYAATLSDGQRLIFEFKPTLYQLYIDLLRILRNLPISARASTP